MGRLAVKQILRVPKYIGERWWWSELRISGERWRWSELRISLLGRTQSERLDMAARWN